MDHGTTRNLGSLRGAGVEEDLVEERTKARSRMPAAARLHTMMAGDNAIVRTELAHLVWYLRAVHSRNEQDGSRTLYDMSVAESVCCAAAERSRKIADLVEWPPFLKIRHILAQTLLAIIHGAPVHPTNWWSTEGRRRKVRT
jgi:hypothetical protein